MWTRSQRWPANDYPSFAAYVLGFHKSYPWAFIHPFLVIYSHTSRQDDIAFWWDGNIFSVNCCTNTSWVVFQHRKTLWGGFPQTRLGAQRDPRVHHASMYIHTCVVSIKKALDLAEMEIKVFCMLLHYERRLPYKLEQQFKTRSSEIPPVTNESAKRLPGRRQTVLSSSLSLWKTQRK